MVALPLCERFIEKVGVIAIKIKYGKETQVLYRNRNEMFIFLSVGFDVRENVVPLEPSPGRVFMGAPQGTFNTR